MGDWLFILTDSRDRCYLTKTAYLIQNRTCVNRVLGKMLKELLEGYENTESGSKRSYNP